MSDTPWGIAQAPCNCAIRETGFASLALMGATPPVIGEGRNNRIVRRGLRPIIHGKEADVSICST
ncbi:MAG: hypothetical protein HZB80_08675 [Deltaproteobacteria bacterium]|nr:hypothetical protein [Deltaproteobacteria bacterium]